MSHVFISYARKDKSLVNPIVEWLQVNDFVIWQDVSDLSGGDRWWDAIQNAIDNSDAVLVFWSENAKSSKWVKKEIVRAKERGKRIIPVLLDGTKLSKDLNHIEAVSKSQREDIKTALDPISTKIKRQEMGFKLAIPMYEQSIVGTRTKNLHGIDYLFIPFISSSYSHAQIIAQPNTIVSDVTRIQLIIQCSNPVNDDKMVTDVFEKILEEDKENSEAPPLVGLYITTITRQGSRGKEYFVDEDNVAHYSDIDKMLSKAIQLIMTGKNKVIQVFQQTPLEISFLLGRNSDWKHTFQLYRLKRGSDPVSYTRIMDIPSR